MTDIVDSRTAAADPFVGSGHDHERCVADAVAAAAALCARRGVRLTPLRRRVLELVWQSHTPVGAYELLDMLRADRRGAAPPTVYRALDFLREQGLVHRIDSRNAYLGCASPEAGHCAHFLICTSCGQAAEIDDRALHDAITRSAEQAGFQVRGETVEITGICSACHD